MGKIMLNGKPYSGGSSSGGTGGGHTILDSAGNPLTQRANLQFDGVNVSDDSENDATIIHGQLKLCATEEEWDELTQAEKDDPNIYWVRPWADTENFASDKTPVGAVISAAADAEIVESPFPTGDYLLCNGDVVNIAEYPKLANYFQDAYGSKNYFGGDGVITIGLPDFTADYPENGVLCIKAKVTENVITMAEIDDTTTSSTSLWSSAKINTLASTKADTDLVGKVEIIGAAASQPYTAGSYFIGLNNDNEQGFYLATAAIAQGATITVGTNCSKTDVGSQLSQLNSNLNQFNNVILPKKVYVDTSGGTTYADKTLHVISQLPLSLSEIIIFNIYRNDTQTQYGTFIFSGVASNNPPVYGMGIFFSYYTDFIFNCILKNGVWTLKQLNEE